MVRLIVIVVAVFLGIYLLSRWLDRGQPSPDDDEVVSDGAGKVLIIIASVVAILLFLIKLALMGQLTYPSGFAKISIQTIHKMIIKLTTLDHFLIFFFI